MKRKFIHRAVALLVAALCLFASGCGEGGAENARQISYREDKKWKLYSDVDVYYADVSDYEYLRPYLVRLLANEQQPVVDYEDKSIMGYEAPDPNSPYILPSISYALFDVNLDGIPELMAEGQGYGGTAGNTSYFAYDIITGKEIGVISGGSGAEWVTCFFYDDSCFKNISRYSLRSGWAQSFEYIGGIEYLESDGQYHTKNYFSYSLTYELYDHPEGGKGLSLVESSYYAYGEELSAENFLIRRDAFDGSYDSISETEMRRFTYSDVCPDEEDSLKMAKKMAQALLSSSQKISLPLREVTE